MRSFEYHAPRTLDAAVDLLASYGGKARVLAGGTDLLIRVKRNEWRPEAVVNIKRIPGLREISRAGNTLWIGALATMNDLARSDAVAACAPVLAEAAATVAGVQVRNLATVGGNICNASPSADLAPPLLVLDARVEVAGLAGRRRLPLDEFFRGPGQTVLADGELVTGFELPDRTGWRAGYRKMEHREAMDIAIASVAVGVPAEGRPQIALGAVAPVPMRARQAEGLLAGQPLVPERVAEAARAAAAECQPIDDIRSSAWYRRQLVEVLTARLLTELGGLNG